jgi:imidazolonepropionase-like amidohydrolase
VDTTQYDTIIHIDGSEVYPAFIAPNSRLGLVEIDAVRASRDFDEVGLMNPHVRSLTAYNTESRITPTVRSNGVLIAQSTPKGGLISGTSSIFELEGWNWEDACLKMDDGIHLNWPLDFPRRRWNDPKEVKKAKEAYQKSLQEISDFFKEAEAYHQSAYRLEKDLKMEAMAGLFSKEQKLYIHADRVNQITDAIYFFDQYDMDIVLVGGYESWLVAELLKDRDIPVILRRVHSLPMNQDDDTDLPFKLPKLLSDKGLLVALENSGSMEAMGSRNLPFYAGTAVAYGLDKEVAVAMLSYNTAKILGIDNKVGSLELGKDATLFISKGDALDMMSNDLTHAFVRGKLIDLDDPQKFLYRKYKAKYEGQNN